MTSSLHSTIVSAIQELEIRQQVAGSLREVVRDVETAQHWTDYLQSTRRCHQLRAKVEQQEVVLLERRTAATKQRHEQAQLADQFVTELRSLSQLLEEWQAVKDEHEKLQNIHDEAIVKLRLAEKELHDTKQVSFRATISPSQTSNLVESADVESTGHAIAEENITDQQAIQQAVRTISESFLLNSNDVENTNTASLGDTSDVVSPPPRLDELDNKLMLRIFDYLDAMDILNAAQVNVSLYSRVDALFGTGQADFEETNGIDEASSIVANNNDTEAKKISELPALDETKQSPDSRNTAAVTPVVDANLAKVSTTLTIAPPSDVSTSTSRPATVASNVKTGVNDIISTAGTLKVTDTATSSGSATSTAFASKDGSLGLFSNVVQSPNKLSPTRTNSLPSSPSLRSTLPKTTKKESPPLTASMSNNIATKLSDAELNAIISLTDRLKQREIMAERLARDNEALAAKLTGTEVVKQFLVSRLREMEASLVQFKQGDAIIAEQIASDQEVIAFLDGSVQELEMERDRAAREKMEIASELARIKEQAEQKSVVMSDMLQYERERLRESEREWKAAKKLLIKEVKSCRAHIDALQAERDGCREQFERLRAAVLSSSSSASPNKSVLLKTRTETMA